MENKKIVIIGGVAGGASAAARARRLDEHAKIIMFEKGPNVSFSNCSLPFHLSGIVEDANDLMLMTPNSFKKIYNIDAIVNHEVLSINREEKYVEVKDLINNKVFKETYDTLVMSPGASPVMPASIKGIDGKHVFSVRNVEDIVRIKSYLEDIEDVAVIGAGFIGLEMAENLRLAGKNVSVIEAAPHALMPMDEDFAQIVHRELIEKGVNLIVNDGLAEITEEFVVLNSGKEISAKAVIMSIGVRPETRLANEAGIELGSLGGIKVNHNYQTNDKDIYAVGDVIEETCLITLKDTRLTMAGPAQRQAKRAMNHLYGRNTNNPGVVGASILQVFDLNVAFTGLNSQACERNGIDYGTAYVIIEDKVGIMPDMNMMHFKLVYAKPSGKILGAQAIGKGAVDKRIDVISTVIRFGGTLEDLHDLELAYSPTYNHPKDVVNHAAAVGLNLLNGEIRQVDVSKARELVESGAYLIDTREKPALAKGTIKGSHHIPVSEFRDRLDEIPKDRPVYLFCQTGIRSYNMARGLMQLGFDNITNIAGSFMGICDTEYYKDKSLDRDPIVTNYYFK